MTPREAVDQVLAGRRRTPASGAGEAFAPANIALVKYWGKRDAGLNLPVTSSLSVSLGGSGTRTTVRPAAADAFLLNGAALDPAEPAADRLRRYLDLFRTSETPAFAVDTANNIPTAAGLASSASGFAALALALDRLFGWALDTIALSILARLGSGSACRSVCGGFVEWRAGHRPDGMDSHARPLEERWPSLRVGLWLVEAGPKPVGSREGMAHTVETSPLYAAWPDAVVRDLRAAKEAIRVRDFAALGAAAEANALTMHATMLAARPSLLYWRPATVEAIARVGRLRGEGLPLYLTIDAGPNVKLLFEERDEAAVAAAFPGVHVVRPFGAAAAAAAEGTMSNLEIRRKG